MLKRKQQAKNTKDKLFQCANKLFQEKGYKNTNVKDIVEAADVSVGAFYHHFKSKEDILRLWIEELDKQYLEYYRNVLCGDTMQNTPALQKIRMLMSYINTIFFSENIVLSRDFYAYMLGDDEAGRNVTSPDRIYYAILGELVNLAINQGEIKESIKRDKVILTVTILFRGYKVEAMMRESSLHSNVRTQEFAKEEDELLVDYLKSISTDPMLLDETDG